MSFQGERCFLHLVLILLLMKATRYKSQYYQEKFMNETIEQEEKSLLDWFENKNESVEICNELRYLEETHQLEFIVQDMFLDHFFP